MQRGRGNAIILSNPVLCLFNFTDAIIFKQGDFWIFMYVLYSTLLHLPPLIFHCDGGCWDRTQDSFVFGIG